MENECLNATNHMDRGQPCSVHGSRGIMIVTSVAVINLIKFQDKDGLFFLDRRISFLSVYYFYR